MNRDSDRTASVVSVVAADGAHAMVALDDRTIRLARDAAQTEAGGPSAVGAYCDAVAEDETAVSASFEATDNGYRGWRWVVSLAVVDPGRPTVSEVVLLPGPDALLAPPWVPWEQRVRSGDLKVGDLLPPAPDDYRLVPAYLLSDDPAVEQVAHELGIGRVRVLSREGREDAAERWHDGPFGPDGDMALHAPAHCVTCGFYLPLAGSLGAMLGACGNEYSPADGRVVDAEFGCGAHSEVLTLADVPARSTASATVIDELRLEMHQRADAAPLSMHDGSDLGDGEIASSDDDEREPQVRSDPGSIDEAAADGATAEDAGPVPDLAVPDVAVPDVAVPDVAVPNAPVSDAAAADVAAIGAADNGGSAANTD